MPPRSRKDKTTDDSAGEESGSSQQEAAAPKAKRKPQSIYLNEELLDRVRAAVTALSAYQPEANVRSLSDVFEPGAWAEVQRLEREYNGGEPFTPVAKMPSGRPR